MLNKVVFPAPFGPISPTSSCSPICKLTFLTATKPPNLIVRPHVSSSIGFLAFPWLSMEPRPQVFQAVAYLHGNPSRHEENNNDQQQPVDQHAHSAGRCAKGCPQKNLKRRDERGAKNRAYGGAHPADNGIERE